MAGALLEMMNLETIGEFILERNIRNVTVETFQCKCRECDKAFSQVSRPYNSSENSQCIENIQVK